MSTLIGTPTVAINGRSHWLSGLSVAARGNLRTGLGRSTGPVIDDELLAQRLAQAVEHHAPEGIHAAAEWIREDDADAVVWVGLRA